MYVCVEFVLYCVEYVECYYVWMFDEYFLEVMVSECLSVDEEFVM